jgi:hypothetical protein
LKFVDEAALERALFMQKDQSTYSRRAQDHSSLDVDMKSEDTLQKRIAAK